MVIQNSRIRDRNQRAEGQIGARESRHSRKIQRVLAGLSARRDDELELEGFQLPDLLSPVAGPGPATDRLHNLIDLAFLGRASAGEIDREIEEMDVGPSEWDHQNFFDDLFLSEVVRGNLRIEIGGQTLPCHREFIQSALAHPATDLATIRYRQGIVRELDSDPDRAREFEQLLIQVTHLLMLLRASRDDARLQPVRFRLDVLRSLRRIVDLMNTGFEGATSGLQRLHSSAAVLLESESFRTLAALLDHDDGLASLELSARIGANGKLRHLEITGLKELKKNPFYRGPLRRWWDRLRMSYRRYNLGPDELVDRLVMQVYATIAPALVRVIQLLAHLEFYQAARSFRQRAEERGLAVCLPDIAAGQTLDLQEIFNPLLMRITQRPVTSDLRMPTQTSVNLVTGPNSGGKTRLLQAIGITQVLGQCGLYVPCRSARLPLVPGLFASIVENDRADQVEGRLGSELLRLKTLFESVPSGALILLDELCSGTNPSEAIEIVETVLRLLERVEPVAFVTTHFLDFAHQLSTSQPHNGLTFLQAEVDQQRGATYRFIPGVAQTSLAIGTAERLGMTFAELERRLNRHN